MERILTSVQYPYTTVKTSSIALQQENDLQMSLTLLWFLRVAIMSMNQSLLSLHQIYFFRTILVIVMICGSVLIVSDVLIV